VSPLNTEEIAKAIAHCMSDPSHRASLTKLGLRRSRDFDWTRTAEQTLDVYRQVLSTAKGARGNRDE
jgi:glycosyltransferase involved in cell wall biosynthesis